MSPAGVSAPAGYRAWSYRRQHDGQHVGDRVWAHQEGSDYGIDKRWPPAGYGYHFWHDERQHVQHEGRANPAGGSAACEGPAGGGTAAG